mgnify:CR=1 FL=1
MSNFDHFVGTRAVSDQLTCLLKGQVTLQGASQSIELSRVTAAYFGE